MFFQSLSIVLPEKFAVKHLFWSLWSVTCLQTLANLISYDILHHDKDDEKHLLQFEVKSVQFGNESLTSRVKKRAML